MTKLRLTESVSLAEAKPTGTPNRYKVRFIKADGWGSSGYYSHKVLESAVASQLFRTGTPMFIDHPTASDRMERPERSIRDLAGVIDSGPVMESDGVWGEVQVYPHMAPIIESMRQHIGVSINAYGNSEHGEAEGRRGPIITELTEVASVDYVTAPGAGGQIGQLIEAARAMPSPMTETTTDDRRDQIVRALPARSWLRDYDPDLATAYFDTYSDDRTRSYSQGYTISPDDQSVSLAGTPVEVRVVTTYVPVSSAGPVTERKKEMIKMPEIAADRLAELEKSAGRVTELEAQLAEANARNTENDRRNAERDLAEAAKIRARSKMGEEVPAQMQAKVIAKITEAGKIPTKNDKLDEPAFDLVIEEAVKAERDYLASYQTPGRVTGFGSSAPADQVSITESRPTNAWGRSTKKEN